MKQFQARELITTANYKAMSSRERRAKLYNVAMSSSETTTKTYQKRCEAIKRLQELTTTMYEVLSRAMHNDKNLACIYEAA